MKRNERWFVATVVAVAVTAGTGTAAAAGAAPSGRGEGQEGGRMTASAASLEWSAAPSRLWDWLHQTLSVLWGATRGTIIPGDTGDGGDDSLVATPIDAPADAD